MPFPHPKKSPGNPQVAHGAAEDIPGSIFG